MSKSNGPIRRWLGKLGLVSDYSEEQIPTAELPDIRSATQPEPEVQPEPELLSEQELEVSTADTRPLPPELAETLSPVESKTDEQEMESKVTPVGNQTADPSQRGSGPLLDLGDFAPARAAAEEDFVLDIDFDDNEERPAPVASSSVSTVSGEAAQMSVGDSATSDYQSAEAVSYRSDSDRPTNVESLEPTSDPMAETQELVRPVMSGTPPATDRAFAEPEIFEGEAVRMVSEPAPSGQINLEQLSPEAVDAIARRAVEMLSERVVQEIAWEVVPQLAELLIKRQLEEKSS